MKNVLIALLGFVFIGCAGPRINTPPTALPKLPCGVVFDETDEESGQEFLGLMCLKDKLMEVVTQWEHIDAWQKDAWRKCGPDNGKTKK